MSEAHNASPQPGRIDCVLVASGKFHDIDFARLELLKLLGEDERIRVRVFEDYSNLEAIRNAAFLVTYTCDVVPSLDEQEALRAWVAGGGRWYALHGTASILRFLDNGLVDSPALAPHFMETLGSQFIHQLEVHLPHYEMLVLSTSVVDCLQDGNPYTFHTLLFHTFFQAALSPAFAAEGA